MVEEQRPSKALLAKLCRRNHKCHRWDASQKPGVEITVICLHQKSAGNFFEC